MKSVTNKNISLVDEKVCEPSPSTISYGVAARDDILNYGVGMTLIHMTDKDKKCEGRR